MLYEKLISVQKYSIQLEIEPKCYYERWAEFDDDLLHNATYRNIKWGNLTSLQKNSLVEAVKRKALPKKKPFNPNQLTVKYR